MKKSNEIVDVIRNRIINEIESKNVTFKRIKDINGENELPLNLTVNFRTLNGELIYQFDRMYELPEYIKRMITDIVNEEI